MTFDPTPVQAQPIVSSPSITYTDGDCVGFIFANDAAPYITSELLGGDMRVGHDADTNNYFANCSHSCPSGMPISVQCQAWLGDTGETWTVQGRIEHDRRASCSLGRLIDNLRNNYGGVHLFMKTQLVCMTM